ncbi:hypothetical protein PTKIN_Ptkin05aG0147400 [Pterospermum kingtungense]
MIFEPFSPNGSLAFEMALGGRRLNASKSLNKSSTGPTEQPVVSTNNDSNPIASEPMPISISPGKNSNSIIVEVQNHLSIIWKMTHEGEIQLFEHTYYNEKKKD